MAGVPSSAPTPAASAWQVNVPAAGKPLDLSLPAETKPAKVKPRPITLDPKDWQEQSPSYGRYNFDQVVEFNQAPQTRGEFIAQTRQGLRDSFGEKGARSVEAVAGAAYLATGGKVKISRDARFMNQDVKVDFSASAKHGGTFGLGVKMQLGGR